MTDLTTRCEQVQESETRELLEEAFLVVFGPIPPSEYDGRAWKRNEPDFSPAWTAYTKRRTRFNRMLDAEAYLEAAMLLAPEAWECAIYWNISPFEPEAQLENEQRRTRWLEPVTGRAKTPALALLAAILRAKETDDGRV